jgi:hypothetical protein
MNSLSATLCAATLACGLTMAPHASAATASKTFYVDPAMACQLSLPTIDTAVRPRATGYRNEGNSSTFVICGLPYSSSGGSPTSFAIGLYSFDGADHEVSCTGVTRYSWGPGSEYSVKSATVSSEFTPYTITWTSTDLSMNNYDASVTCSIPKGVAIVSAQITVTDYIGN